MQKTQSGKSILFLPSNKAVPANEELSLLDMAMRHRIELNHSCGGMGSCTTCRVFIEKGLEKLGPRTEVEQERAEERCFSDHERLACQTRALGGLVVRIPE